MSTIFAIFYLLQASAYCQQRWNLDEIRFIIDIHYQFCTSKTLIKNFENDCPEDHFDNYEHKRPKRDVYNGEMINFDSDFEIYTGLKIPNGSIICCEPCSCNVSSCNENKDCCPDYFLRAQGEASSISECIRPELKPERDFYTYTGTEVAYNMITSCEDRIITNGRINVTISDKCLNSAKYNSIYAKIPVSNNATNTIYLNRYCAYCNGLKDEDIIYWQPRVVCHSGQFTPRNMETIVDDLLLSDGCNMITEPVTDEKKNKCRHIPITKCNVTGKWVKYDPLIERACGAYTALFQTIYRNVFCYLCNEIQPLEKLYCKLIQVVSFTFVTFLKIDQIQEPKDLNEDNPLSVTKIQQNMCTKDGLFDPIQEKCIRMVCRGYKIFIDGRCISTANKIAGVIYDAFFKISVKESPSDEHFTNLFDNMKRIFRSHLENNNINIFQIKIFLKESENYSLTGFEFVVIFIQFFIPLKKPVDILAIDSIYNFHNATIYVQFSSQHNALKCFVEMDIFKKEIRELNFSYPSISLIDYKDDVALTELPQQNIEEDSIPVGQSIILFPAQNCLLVELNASFYNITHYSWGIFIQELNKEFKKSEYLEDNGDTYMDIQTDSHVLICREKIQPLFQKFLNGKSEAKILSLRSDIFLLSAYFVFFEKLCFEM